jgi:hypothetical protein
MTALGGVQWQIFDNCHDQFVKDEVATVFYGGYGGSNGEFLVFRNR